MEKKKKEKGCLYIVATPIGNLKDITYRAVETLKNVDLIIAEDTRQTIKLLRHLDIVKKCISYHKFNEKERVNEIIEKLHDGINIALVSDAGTPAISDPGEILVKECIEQDITIIPIPGAVALINALVCSGMDTTQFVFEGFIPINKKQRAERLENIANEKRTIVIYEAPHKVLNTLEDLYKVLGDREICLCREITKLYEEFKRVKISKAIEYYKEKNPRGEFVLVVEGLKNEIIQKEYSNTDVIAMVDKLTKTGIDKKEAMKEVSKVTRIAKREIYKLMIGE